MRWDRPVFAYEKGSTGAVNVITQGYILMEKRDRISDIVMVEKDICAVIERICFVIGKAILSMVLGK